MIRVGKNKHESSFQTLKMSLIVEPELYAPSISSDGSYIDLIPPFANLPSGLRCPCSNRRDQKYETRQSFVIHSKTAMHQRWLQSLNANRSNHFSELDQAKTTIANQKLVIAQLEREVRQMTITIQCLSRQIAAVPHPPPATMQPAIDLLDFD